MTQKDPATFSDAEVDRGRLLFTGPCAFYYAAQKLEMLPPVGGPEVAFAGRSNVGKSSLINALTGRNRLARASSEPGRTKQLNFFDLGGEVSLVDMPGYGYAKASKQVKEDWQGLMFAYLRGRPSLTRVFLLLDARIELKKADQEAMTLFDHAAVVYQLVLTKCDQVKPAALVAKRREVDETIRKHPAAYPFSIWTSSETGSGIPLLRAEVARLIDAPAARHIV